MKENKYLILDYVYIFLMILLTIIYLFPGSLIGLILMKDIANQPIIIANPYGSSINHLIAFMLITIFGLIERSKKTLINRVIFISTFSIILELFHFLIPNRSFEIIDVFANLFGIIISILIILILKKWRKK
tara:strand:- start:364 stop:756 length:393 start_codon:yes stop_codon:yes gene_type:complete